MGADRKLGMVHHYNGDVASSAAWHILSQSYKSKADSLYRYDHNALDKQVFNITNT
jgi:hypothetical protein